MTELMTLKPPFAELDLFSAIEAATRGEVPLLSERIQRRYRTLTPIWRKLLSRNPDDRPEISSVIDDLKEVMNWRKRSLDEHFEPREVRLHGLEAFLDLSPRVESDK